MDHFELISEYAPSYRPAGQRFQRRQSMPNPSWGHRFG